jgi:PBP1b-binding outer membrane lipoprotein LpoB
MKKMSIMAMAAVALLGLTGCQEAPGDAFIGK